MTKKIRIYKLLIIFCLMPIVNSFGQTWTQVPGFSPFSVWQPINKMCVYKNQLYVIYPQGDSIQGMRSRYVARWNGTIWDSLSYDISVQPTCMGVYNNKLYFAGGSVYQLNNIGGVYSWDSLNWSSTNIQSGDDITVGSALVYAMQEYKGELYVGGRFTKVGGKNCSKIARWNGTDWNPVSGGVSLNLPEVDAMVVYKGELIVAGGFSKAGNINVNNIARWDGTKWDSLGNGVIGGGIGAMIVDTLNDVLYVAGGFNTAGGQTSNGLAKWDGSTWTSISNGPLPGGRLHIFNNKLYTGGGPTTVTYNSYTIRNIAVWNGGTNWLPVTTGLNQAVGSFCTYKGEFYVGGNFTEAGGINGIKWLAKYNDGVGINDAKNKNYEFKIYPNPGNGQITIEFESKIEPNEKMRLCLYDNIGKEINCTQLTQLKTQIFNTSQLSQGIYFINLIDENKSKVTSQKFVVE